MTLLAELALGSFMLGIALAIIRPFSVRLIADRSYNGDVHRAQRYHRRGVMLLMAASAIFLALSLLVD